MTPEEKAAAQAKIEARVAELKAMEGKPFKRTDGKGGIVKVLKYAGIGVKDGQSYHSLLVEGDQMRWTPTASDFLKVYEPATEEPTETKTEVI